MIKGDSKPVARTRFVNPADLYDQALAVAKAAVAGSPPKPYSLADITEDDTLSQAIFNTACLSTIPLHATLDGCAQALISRNITAEHVAATQTPAPESTPVTDTDMATARHWLTDTLNDNLDGDRQQLMIVDHVLENGWETHPTRLSSLMLAVVETTDAVLSPTLTRQSPTRT